ncbi:hydroxyindole O-methyltransferase [Apiospora rasikravindrae]|uniref:Hydroxyindole O-methyltransferase n=1 Tax=Apiospora rasikravindrae TaxID=990691 RepID=A0ABR1TCH6_9PEZI
MSSPSVSALLERIAVAGKAYENSQEPGSREELIDLSQSLVAALEIPSEFIQRSFWSEPAKSAHIRLAVDVDLFQHLRAAGARLLRHLAATKLVVYGKDGKWRGTPLTDGLADQKYQHSIAFCYDVARPSFNGFPAYFRETGYKQPTSLTDGPFQAAHGTKLPFFDWLVATPPHLAHFDSFMSAYRAGKPDWWDFYPVAEQLVAGFDPGQSDAFLVDVGGGRGHDLVQFAKVHGSHPGRLVLQDREPVVATAETSDRFEAQAHDFFTPQPVRFARAYALHSILHDWGDAEGVRILENLRPALKQGYSRVLFNEIVLSEEKPTLAATSMDMMMLAHFAVKERTEREWRAIIESAGLRVVKIYSYPGVAESVIEAELA